MSTCVISLVISFLLCGPVQADILTGLVAHYKMNEGTGTSVGDSAGTHTATFFNMEATDWVPGKLGYGLAFDGVNERVATTTNPYFAASATTISLAFWISMPTSAFTGAVKCLIDDSDGNVGTSGFQCLADDRGAANGITPTAALVCLLRTTTGTFRLTGADNAFDATATWRHLVLTYNGSLISLYRNGVAMTAEIGSAGTGNFIPTNAALVFGSERSGGIPAAMQLDDVRLYSRALSATDVLEVYNTGAARKGLVLAP